MMRRPVAEQEERIRQIGRTSGTASMMRVRRRGEEPAGDGPVDVLDICGPVREHLPCGCGGDSRLLRPGGPAAFIERDELGVETVVARRVPPQASRGVGASGTREFQGGCFG